ncbi:MAG: ubiquinone biosynthesis regulatory protein kinase UbiB, partial [Blastocatellia bacterium]
KKLKKQLPEWAEQIPEMPGLAHRVLQDTLNGQLELNWKSRQLEEIQLQLAHNNRRTIRAISGSAFIISGAILSGLSGYLTQSAQPLPLLAWGAFAAGMVLIALALKGA